MIDFFPMFFVIYAIGFLEVLQNRLESLKMVFKEKSKKQDFEKNVNELKNCIEFQEKINEYIGKVEKTISSVFLLQGFSSTFILCFTTFLLTTVSEILHRSSNFEYFHLELSMRDPLYIFCVVYAITMLIQISIPCH